MRRMRFARRRTPGWLVLIVLLAAVTLAGGVPYAIAGRDARRPPFERLPTRLDPAAATPAMQEVRVYEVIDGDTIDVEVDGRVLRVRYYGIDTPERGDRCYREALDRNQSLVGRRVLLLKDARETDPFGRLLRYVFLPDGTSVDATLVAEGFALAWREDGRYRDQIVSLEAQARQAARGCLW